MLRRQAGAAGLLVSLLTGVLATGGVGAVDVAAAVAAQSRAENAADAVAHAVAAVLAVDPDREHLSLSAQAGNLCDTDSPPDPAAEKACARALAVARDVAGANRAVLLRLTVGPDVRDLRAERGAGRVVTLALAAVRRGLPVLPAHCPPMPGRGPDLCWAEAWSAAQESG
jgi:Flp pilus assembly protein TadG